MDLSFHFGSELWAGMWSTKVRLFGVSLGRKFVGVKMQQTRISGNSWEKPSCMELGERSFSWEWGR